MVIDDLTRQLPHFGITCPVKPEMNSPWKFLRKMLEQFFFIELLNMILCKPLTLTVLYLFKNVYIYIYHSPLFNLCQFLISLLVNYFIEYLVQVLWFERNRCQNA